MSGILVSILALVVHWKLFEKAGEEGWKALIPIYNLYILFKITWGADRAMVPMAPILGTCAAGIAAPFLSVVLLTVGLWISVAVLVLLAIANLVVWVLTMLKLADAYAKGIPFALGLLFLYPIFSAVLAFGDLEYYEPW